MGRFARRDLVVDPYLATEAKLVLAGQVVCYGQLLEDSAARERLESALTLAPTEKNRNKKHTPNGLSSGRGPYTDFLLK